MILAIRSLGSHIAMEFPRVMEKLGIDRKNERGMNSYFQDFSITPSYKLGLTWTMKSLYFNGFTLKSPRRKHITHCLLSGRSQVQLPPGTQVCSTTFSCNFVFTDRSNLFAQSVLYFKCILMIAF